MGPVRQTFSMAAFSMGSDGEKKRTILGGKLGMVLSLFA
jgi:hypothetical protein